MKHYRRIKEDDIESIPAPSLDTMEDVGYSVRNINAGYKTFDIIDINLYILNKATGILTDPFFKTPVKTDPLNANIKESKFFYTGYWGGTEEFPYFEFGMISSSEAEIYKTMRDMNVEEGIMGKFNNRKRTYIYHAVHPFQDGR